MTILILLSVYLKLRNRPNTSQTIICSAMIVCYVFPILNAQYIYRFQNGKDTVSPLNHESTDVNTWLYIEIYFSFIWIFAVMVFLLSAYIIKKKSIFKKGAGRQECTGNIWL